MEFMNATSGFNQTHSQGILQPTDYAGVESGYLPGPTSMFQFAYMAATFIGVSNLKYAANYVALTFMDKVLSTEALKARLIGADKVKAFKDDYISTLTKIAINEAEAKLEKGTIQSKISAKLPEKVAAVVYRLLDILSLGNVTKQDMKHRACAMSYAGKAVDEQIKELNFELMYVNSLTDQAATTARGAGAAVNSVITAVENRVNSLTERGTNFAFDKLEKAKNAVTSAPKAAANWVEASITNQFFNFCQLN